MRQSKLVKLFLALDKIELRYFKKYLQSSLHHSHKESTQLFDFLLHKRSLTDISLQKTRAWHHVFGNKSYEDHKMRSLMNTSFETLKNFVGIFHTLSDEFSQRHTLIKALIQKNQLSIAQKEWGSLRAQVEAETVHSAAHFHRQFQLESLQFELAGTQERTASNNLSQIFDHSANYFMIQTLRYACIGLSHSNVSSITYEVPLLQAILDHLSQQEAHAPPSIQLFYFTYLALAHQDVEAFSKLKRSFSIHRDRLPVKQQHELLIMAINFCIKRLNTGDRVYAQEAFALYKEGLQNHILLENGIISRFNFKNVVSIGLMLRAFDWVESFIEQYSKALKPDYRQSYHDFNLARLRFVQGDYRQAKRMLTVLEYDDVFFNLSARMMMVKMHYEEQEWDALDALLLNFSRYLQRRSVIGYHKQVYQNFLKLARQLIQLPPNDEKAAIQLKKQMLETQPLAERDWLLKQVKYEKGI